jgi:hypothetical protein
MRRTRKASGPRSPATGTFGNENRASILSPDVDEQSLNQAMQQWTSEARLEQARAARQAHRWQNDISADEAKFSGLLQDLSERRSLVSISTEGGRRLTGSIYELGSDFVAISNIGQAPTFIRLHSVIAVEVDGSPRDLGTPSDRSAAGQRTLDMVISELASEKTPVRFATKNAVELRTAKLTSSGIDVVTLELAGPPVRTLFVATDQLSEIAIAA